MSLVMHFSWSGHVFLCLHVHGSTTSHCAWLAFPNYACVVFRNFGLDIAHAAITNLDCVPVENLM